VSSSQTIRRRKSDSSSIFVMRTFVATVDEMDDRELVAMTNWIVSKTRAILRQRAEQRQAEQGVTCEQ